MYQNEKQRLVSENIERRFPTTPNPAVAKYTVIGKGPSRGRRPIYIADRELN